MRRALVWLTSALAVVGLTACGPHAVSVDRYGGPPPGVAADVWLNGESPAVWDGERLHILLGGSSSCEALPTAVEERAGTVRVRVERTGGDICTLDMQYVTHVLRLDGGAPERVVLVGEWGEHELEVLVSGE